MKIEKLPFGELPDGTKVELYRLENSRGITAALSTYGATLVSMHVPDRAGKYGDIVLGHESLEGYLKASPYFGSTCGRCANRIDSGKFTLDGREYALARNDGGRHHLHGGVKGFDKVVWAASELRRPDAVGVRFACLSRDGDEGYPGNLNVTVTYTLTETCELRLNYIAATDKPTVVNLTNHAYWNLAPGRAADILNHELMLNADNFTPVNSALIPTGKLQSVKGTPMDFTEPRTIGSRIAQIPGGYDHNYAINNGGKAPVLAARLSEKTTGRVMEIETSEPGIQLYTGNFLDGTIKGKAGIEYGKHSGLCLETQHFPNAVNTPAFASVVLRPGQTYRHLTVHRFSIAR
ncbi:MAG TPA: aldose epimerase family protein [Sedimentisphaerales bacterium]|nr:aldose epimerase family protein [Sedimentisphaerales bacterium]